jgi:hypothetical protein
MPSQLASNHLSCIYQTDQYQLGEERWMEDAVLEMCSDY